MYNDDEVRITCRSEEKTVEKLDWKLKIALGFLGLLTIYSLPLFPIVLGAVYVGYLNRNVA